MGDLTYILCKPLFTSLCPNASIPRCLVSPVICLILKPASRALAKNQMSCPPYFIGLSNHFQSLSLKFLSVLNHGFSSFSKTSLFTKVHPTPAHRISLVTLSLAEHDQPFTE